MFQSRATILTFFLTSGIGGLAMLSESGFVTSVTAASGNDIYAATTLPPHSSFTQPASEPFEMEEEISEEAASPLLTDLVINPTGALPVHTAIPSASGNTIDNCAPFRAYGISVSCAAEPLVHPTEAPLETGPSVSIPTGEIIHRKKRGSSVMSSLQYGFPAPSGERGHHICDKIIPAYHDENNEIVENLVYPCYMVGSATPTLNWHLSGSWQPHATQAGSVEDTVSGTHVPIASVM